MDEIEKARELFMKLESGIGQGGEIARRAFLIQERLSEKKD
jgi:hypothetical protein